MMRTTDLFKKIVQSSLIKGYSLDFYVSQGRMLGLLTLEEFHALLRCISVAEKEGTYESLYREINL